MTGWSWRAHAAFVQTSGRLTLVIRTISQSAISHQPSVPLHILT
jgi:hypothetical protein